jgi:hypothetical protein
MRDHVDCSRDNDEISSSVEDSVAEGDRRLSKLAWTAARKETEVSSTSSDTSRHVDCTPLALR